LRLGVAVALATACAASSATAAPPVSGETVFEANCQICHQAGGAGVGGQYPRLAGRAPTIASSPEGRRFMAALMLNGMSGQVTVDGQSVFGVMPPFGQLSDGELAAVLTYVSGLGAGKPRPAPFKPGDIATARAAAPTPSTEMANQRNALAERHLIP
jgi:mono/diheme cytochrome c family protein